jgi:hypothetical protein
MSVETGPASLRAWPQVFVLLRIRDDSGVSGTGVVAEGVVWWNGSASACWRGDTPSVAFFPGGVAAIEAVHGHGGDTWVHYIDGPDALAELEALKAWMTDPHPGHEGAPW